MRWKLIARVNSLPKSLDIDWENPQAIDSNNIPSDTIELIDKSSYYTARFVFQDDQEYFCLEKYGKQWWIKWKIRHLIESDLQNNYNQVSTNKSNQLGYDTHWAQLNIKELLPYWPFQHVLQPAHGNKRGLQLNMTPPNTNIASKKQKNHSHAESDNSNKNPNDYIVSKYNELLFSPDIALAYFVKSTLVRFYNMCKYTAEGKELKLLYKSTLELLVMNISDFDKRHLKQNLLLMESTSAVGRHSFAKARQHCLRKYHIHISDDESIKSPRLTDLEVILKAREIKLQLILLLELINQFHLDQNFQNFQEKYKLKLKHRSLNVTRRGLKRKISTEKQVKKSSIDYCELLDLYLDKLSILEMLLETGISVSTTDGEGDPLTDYKKSILNKAKESSSTGFTRYILIPYFSKKLPNTVKFIMHKIKGPNLKLTGLTVSKNGNNAKDPIQPLYEIDSRQGSTPESVVSTPSSLKSIGSYSRPSLSRRPSFGSQPRLSLSPELLESRTNSNLSEFLEAEAKAMRKLPSSLSRTSSDLVINKLQRRQLKAEELSTKKDNGSLAFKSKTTMTFSQPFTGHETASVASPKSFRRVGKRTRSSLGDVSMAIKDNIKFTNEASVQVMATPMGKTSKTLMSKTVNMDLIVESPTVMTQPDQDFKGNVASPLSNSNSASIHTPSLKQRAPQISVLDQVIEATPKDRPVRMFTDNRVSVPPVKKKVRRRLFGP
ncbi:similar to Saccharomyces cerevisiae YGL113W SLD3 Protein involved in the initiation of DNA replication [Maudiozyma saulgeensis]|uniref:Similar to Saccharomyces cerevisiae YGL113W SLD3 Protein involved in the initiation of DNA replication n=1 Tax=Maudiozyma saulgeensis TaxID=1789683 RepID=A0A1X7RB84_9SACH|nr:similar to Saccharomyces cerevisiae YGL113W SLD3 Protein involved in the initiation of DNA replication [Kazachstania saulgeensis]